MLRTKLHQLGQGELLTVNGQFGGKYKKRKDKKIPKIFHRDKKAK